MKRFNVLMVIILAVPAMLLAENGQDHPSQQPSQDQTQEQQQPQQKPPTLGKAPDDNTTRPPTLGPAPSLNGPNTAKTNDPHRLLRVRTIYIESIDNSLSDKLAEDISKSGPFRIVASAKEADAVMRGTCLDSVRLKHVHSEVFLSGHNGESIWQDVVRRPYRPPTLEKAVDDTAAAIVGDLRASVREAQSK